MAFSSAKFWAFCSYLFQAKSILTLPSKWVGGYILLLYVAVRVWGSLEKLNLSQGQMGHQHTRPHTPSHSSSRLYLKMQYAV